MSVNGITKRWIHHGLSLIFVVLCIITLGFSFIVKGYLYKDVQKQIYEQTNEIVNFFNKSSNVSTKKFAEDIKIYIDNFQDKDSIKIMIFDNEDNVIMTSAGFESYQYEYLPDYNIAKESYSHYGYSTGKFFLNEHCMAATKFIYNANGDNIGAVRYVVPITKIDHEIFKLILLVFIIELIIFFFVILLSIRFIKSIGYSVEAINNVTRKIAQGNFAVKLNKNYDDEIGNLCDSINYMAFELNATEKTKNDFISSVSHELRTPLTAIKGWAETMAMSKINDYTTIEKGLKIIISESERLSGIVEELLDFSRMQNGRMTFMMDKIDILAELDEAVYIFRDRALTEKKELIYNAPDMVSAIWGDKNRLRQVFINIIDNALKYTMEEGSIKIDVSEENYNLKIVVTDNGCGIKQEDLPQIKNKFYKANKTQRGSGIGLAIADEIIKAHSGTLTIVSQEGIGTIVTILLPVMKPNNNSNNELNGNIKNET